MLARSGLIRTRFSVQILLTTTSSNGTATRTNGTATNVSLPPYNASHNARQEVTAAAARVTHRRVEYEGYGANVRYLLT
jgi:hypothetical protein